MIKFLFHSIHHWLSASSPSHEVANDDFQLIILKIGYYEAQNILPYLQAVAAGDILFTIRLNEIDAYNWDKQTITLTKDATDNLLPLEAQDISTIDEISLWRKEIPYVFPARGFIVKSRGEWQYGGIFLSAFSELAIDYPVARLLTEDEKAIISLLPLHIPFVTIDPVEQSEHRTRFLIADEAKDDVKHLEADASYSD